MRQQKAEQEGAILDANVQKEMGKVRSVDAPEVIKNWQEYKQLKKNLYFNKELQKDPLAYNQAQQAAAKKYQDIFAISKKSSELNELQKSLTAGYMKDPNSHADDAGIKINTLMNTPVSGLAQPHPQLGDLTNMENYLDRSINTDFGKMVRDATGTPKQTYSKEEPIQGGLQTKITPYEYGSSPLQVKESLLGTMGMRQAGKDAAKAWDRLPESEIEGTIKAYQALPKEYWERIGLKEPQNLFPKNPDSKAENFAAYQAMKYAVANAPREGKPMVIDNKAAVMKAQEAKDRRMALLKHGYSEAEIRLKDELKDKGEGEQNDIIDKRYEEIKQDALSKPLAYKPAKGSPYSQYSIKVTEPMKKMFAIQDAKGHLIYPDDIRYSSDLKYVVPIFYEHYVNKDKSSGKEERLPQPVIDEKGNAAVDQTLSKPILESDFKERWKKELLGVGGYNKSLKGNSSPKPKPKKVIQNGHEYILNEKTGQYE